MNSAVYQNIPKENIRSSVHDLKLKRTSVLQQDNDHTSKFMGINPPKSLNCNHFAKISLLRLITKLGLENFYPNKLTLQLLLEINKSNTYDHPVQSVKDIPWCFFRRLFTINAECRDCTQEPNNNLEEDLSDDQYDFDFCRMDDSDDRFNPVDIIVALFACADSFLQQQMTLKMSMCQFSVPLLMPHSNNSQCSLMLWALRDIVKEWRPHDSCQSKNFVEDNIVQADMPLYSFVRLKNCSLSKSQLLNMILSRGQQNHNYFIHREMEGGALEKKIANGLVEVCWYLPSGRENLDIFPEPAAFANLRGDICESLTQFNFLYQVSTAVFVFLDKVEENEQKILLSLPDVKTKLFLVVPVKDKNAKEDILSVKAIRVKLDLPKSSIKIKDSKMNLVEFSIKLRAAIKTSNVTRMKIINMFDKAVELGLSVDECRSEYQKKAAEEIVRDIEVQDISDYKKQQLPLQGDNWKKLSQLEKKQCRLKDFGDSGPEDYKCQLQQKVKQIKKEQSTYKLSKGMRTFIANLSTNNKEKQNYFLKWMKLKLDTQSREKLSALRKKFKEACKKKDCKIIAELDQALLESSLGIEHYMREMGLIYEFYLHSQKTTGEIAALPSVVAKMLLDGYPLELLDGDASNIPERWVADVLMELHRKVGEKSRLLVVSVLGVQSTGKSTLLNTMFGVQFPVSSGRCTRGAYMVFLKVGEDLKTELKYDFIVLIDTEGLKSSDMEQLEDSYEHDNELATFVIGLSDVTIINIAMENSTEMKDVLQITVHAFLRMRQIGKKSVCHFVHQNVAGVSAHSKCMKEKKHFLDQLNEMTKIAAKMEKQPSIEAFTDVLDYDIEKNHWNIPGLWHGTPPMAPVNTGYSEAVADFKKNLLEIMKDDRDREATQIPDFLEWMKSLWRAVKYENFIFSFRNTLVAHAYDNLCNEFSQWEWEFRKHIFSWQTEAELEILNTDNESEVKTWEKVVHSKKSQLSDKKEEQKQLMMEKLIDYYARKDRHTNLIEKYKEDFSRSIIGLAKEIEQSVRTKLECTLELKISKKKAQDIQRNYRDVIEEQVMRLLGNWKKSALSDKQLIDEFEKMWTEATINVCGLKEQDIAGSVLMQLKKNFSNRNVNKDLQVDLKEYGKKPFKVIRVHFDSWIKGVIHWILGDCQSFADSAIESWTQFVLDIVKTNGDYHEIFTRDLLEKIDSFVEHSYKHHKTNMQFEIDLKLHICSFATRQFLEMHKKFLYKNNPKSQLEKFKNQYMSDFLDLYKERDHCQRKANDFARVCIKPAVEDYVNRSLGVDIVDEILTSCHSTEYSSRSYFQYKIQRELLQKEDFNSFVRYTSNYEMYVKNWTFEDIKQKMSEDETLSKLKNKILQVIFTKITEALNKASKTKDGTHLEDNKESITEFINNMHKYLIKDISFSEEDEKAILFQIQSTCHPFIKSLKTSIEDLKAELQEEFSKSKDIAADLEKLPIRPHDELFKRVFGCGQQCPFCKVPCEAGGKEHNEHHAAVHRPQGLGRYRNHRTKKLVEVLCTTDVYSETTFSNALTKYEWHPYKDYKTYYPDWHIPADPSIEASDYWKYVLVKYNEQFAEKYDTKPADVPQAWRSITKEQALKGLTEAFNMK
ncbi:up-regulator of cell proliferation-like [Pelmatolapia mariae]|uniref:up-regulator of cell proliferation-like n=1 Tax=Pelmatolapia mariae TaxID=158779 RepID=UPI002FE5E9D7